MKLYEKSNTLSDHLVKTDPRADERVPDGIYRRCPICQTVFTAQQMDEYQTCPNCGYGFRISAQKRLGWLVDDFKPLFSDLKPTDPLGFPGYQAKLAKAQVATGLNDSVLTGEAKIEKVVFNLAIMDPTFIMGSLGSTTGEKLTRLVEAATQARRPVVIFTASGGARMQEGIHSLMQMQKVSTALAEHHRAGLLSIVVLTDPTTGGVTASFAMQADLTLAEPHALVGFAGRRVIEQTTHEQIAHDLQQAENVLRHGFIDQIISRQVEKQTLHQLLRLGGRQDD
ncbi:MAG TPA: acetyl-CoA carboxylase carboxyl transferase subunit beta [Candidatus Limosilactobacillus faecipullorum]|nr:acetyl-CoA carboxylase carboxyl transferase subunit beta [Candidatus Limosilactobacillus faecipullorum]